MYIDMLSNLNIGYYFSDKSYINKLTPITKIICLCIFILTLLFGNNFFGTGILILFILYIIINTNIPLKYFIDIIRRVKLFFFLLFLLMIVIHIPIEFTFCFNINVLLLLIYVTILTVTTSICELNYSFQKLFKNLDEINLSLILNFVPYYINKINDIYFIYLSRGINLKELGLKDRFCEIINVRKRALKITLYKFKIIRRSMIFKYYDLNKNKANLRSNAWTWFDFYLIVIHFIVFILVVMGGVIL